MIIGVERQKNLCSEGQVFLLHGPQGVGKHSLVLEKFREDSCGGPPEISFCTCNSCTLLRENTHPDLFEISAEGASIGVGQIQALVERVFEGPKISSYQCVIIDDASELTEAAGNALLKLLEEPPPTLRIFLIVREVSMVLPTLVSRTLHVVFRGVSSEDLETFLSKHPSVTSPDMVKICANIAQGSVGTALSYLHGGYKQRDKILGVLQAMKSKPYHQILSLVDESEDCMGLFLNVRSIYLDVQRVLYDSSHLTHQDKRSEIKQLRASLNDFQIQKSVLILNTLYSQLPQIRSNLELHVKTAFLKLKFLVSR